MLIWLMKIYTLTTRIRSNWDRKLETENWIGLWFSLETEIRDRNMGYQITVNMETEKLLCGLYLRPTWISVSDFGDRNTKRSQLETKRKLGLKFWRPSSLLVSNLKSLETNLVAGLRFRDQSPYPVSIRDQQDFGLHGLSKLEKNLGKLETEKLNWSLNKIGDQMFWSQNGITSETEVLVWSPFETMYVFGLQQQKEFLILCFRFRDQVKMVVSIRDQ